MFHQNFYPYRYNNYNGYNNPNYYNPNTNYANTEKKDIVSQEKETIPFKDFQPNENNNTINNDGINNTTQSRKQSGFNILGFSFEIDDLIIIGLIILLFLESDKNYALIIILGLILLNVNLSDILNIF